MMELKNNSIYTIDKKYLFRQIYSSPCKEKSCLFEMIYFKNQNNMIKKNITRKIEYDSKNYINSIYEKTNLENFRTILGKLLGFTEDYLESNSLVIGAPNTGIPYGQGFADNLKIPYVQFIEKVKNQKRSFILNKDKNRIEQIKRKFVINLDKNTIKNKNVYFVDDSLVRGHTINVIINILKKYKPKKIHIRIGSPKVLHPCYYGIDMPTKDELLMNNYNEKEYCKKMKIDSLRFLDLKYYREAMESINKNVNNYCDACFTGKHLAIYDF